MKTDALFRSVYRNSPIGDITFVSDGKNIIGVRFANFADGTDDSLSRTAVIQCAEYFSGKRYAFDVPYSCEGTAFQKDVWSAISRIPYGTTVSYSALADMSGHGGACRAAGTACGRNPLPLIVPCHRVTALNGTGGYAYGVSIKLKLLALESEFK